MIVFLSQPLSTRAQTPATVTSINSYAAEVNRFVKVNKKHRIFADISTENDKNAKWKEFKSDKALDDATWYQASNVFSKEGKIVGAMFTFTSPSGDWYHYINYYFRDDGSLAKIRAQLNTAYGDISVVRNRYYDPTGLLIRSTKRFQDIGTSKVVKAPVGFIDEPIPLFKKVSDLPFSKLL